MDVSKIELILAVIMIGMSVTLLWVLIEAVWQWFDWKWWETAEFDKAAEEERLRHIRYVLGGIFVQAAVIALSVLVYMIANHLQGNRF